MTHEQLTLIISASAVVSGLIGTFLGAHLERRFTRARDDRDRAESRRTLARAELGLALSKTRALLETSRRLALAGCIPGYVGLAPTTAAELERARAEAGDSLDRLSLALDDETIDHAINHLRDQLAGLTTRVGFSPLAIGPAATGQEIETSTRSVETASRAVDDLVAIAAPILRGRAAGR